MTFPEHPLCAGQSSKELENKAQESTAPSLEVKARCRDGGSDYGAGWWTEQGQVGQPGGGARVLKGISRSLHKKSLGPVI